MESPSTESFIYQIPLKGYLDIGIIRIVKLNVKVHSKSATAIYLAMKINTLIACYFLKFPFETCTLFQLLYIIMFFVHTMYISV